MGHGFLFFFSAIVCLPNFKYGGHLNDHNTSNLISETSTEASIKHIWAGTALATTLTATENVLFTSFSYSSERHLSNTDEIHSEMFSTAGNTTCMTQQTLNE